MFIDKTAIKRQDQPLSGGSGRRISLWNLRDLTGTPGHFFVRSLT